MEPFPARSLVSVGQFLCAVHVRIVSIEPSEIIIIALNNDCMRTTYQKQWLAYVALFICGASMLIPANGNATVKFVQLAALLIAGILAFIYLYYNIRKQAGINKNG